MRSRSAIQAGIAVVSSLMLAGACAPADGAAQRPPLEDEAITVASFDFPESEVLAEIYAQAMEAAGFTVDRRLDLGPRELVEPALRRGLVEFVPEYAGSALAFVSLGRSTASLGTVATHDSLVRVMAPLGISVLDAAPAQNQNGIAVSATTAAEYDLQRISDLVPVAPQLTFGGPVECPERPLCLLGLESVYGLHFERFVALDASGPLTAGALASGQVDVALMFTTDGRIEADQFRLLVDDRGLQPAENVTPFVRTPVIDRFGEPFVEVVNAVSKALTTDDLRNLNAEMFSTGRSPAEVAARWLRGHGLGAAVE